MQRIACALIGAALFVVCCLVALGYPAEEPPFPGRFGLGEVCFEEHFGQPWTLGEPPD